MIANALRKPGRRRSLAISIAGGFVLFLLAATVFAVASQARSVSSQAERSVQAIENLRVASLARAEMSVASRVAQLAPNEKTLLDGSANNALDALDSLEASFDSRTPEKVRVELSAFRAAVEAQTEVLGSSDTDAVLDAEIQTGAAFTKLSDAMRDEQTAAIDGLQTDNDLMNLIATITAFVVAFVVPSAALFIFQALRRTPRKSRALQLEHDQLQTSSRTMAAAVAREADDLRSHLRTRPTSDVDDRIARSLVRFQHIASVNEAPTSTLIERLDVAEVVDEVLLSIPGATDVTFDSSDVRAVVSADRSQVELVIGELARNALTHGGGPVAVAIETKDENVLVSVADNGPGLPDIVVDAVIHENAFALRGNLLSGNYGFGLVAARRALSAMGGALHYDRDDGKTVVTASLPLAIARQNSRAGATPALAASGTQ